MAQGARLCHAQRGVLRRSFRARTGVGIRQGNESEASASCSVRDLGISMGVGNLIVSIAPLGRSIFRNFLRNARLTRPLVWKRITVPFREG